MAERGAGGRSGGVDGTCAGADVLAGGPRRERAPRRRPPRWLPVLLVLVVVAALGADRLAARHERAALRACLRSGESTVAYHDRRVSAAVDYVSPALTAFGTRPAVRASLRALVERTARDGVPPLERAAARCRSVRVLGWHRDAVRARAAAAAYLVASADHLAAVGRDALVLGRTDPVRAARREQAVRAVGGLPVSP